MNQLVERKVAAMGEKIRPELGIKMIKDYRKAWPENAGSCLIGKTIIHAIMAQQGCAGIRFYNAVNETGKQTLVYVGLNSKGGLLGCRTLIDDDGKIKELLPIVGDRGRPGTRPGALGADDDVFTEWDILNLNVTETGEAITAMLGNAMIRQYRKERPGSVLCYEIGVQILLAILAQPGCEGVRFYNALNGDGAETLVYAGVDAGNGVILEYITVGDDGGACVEKGIVADRLLPGTRPSSIEEDYFGEWRMTE